MANWIRNRSILLVLLTGGVGIIVILGLLLSATATYFLGQSDDANNIRRAADGLNGDFLKAELAEKDFITEDLRNPEFFKTGQSENLARHKTIMTQVAAKLENLAGVTSGRQRELSGQISAAVAAYQNGFQKMVAGFREKGYQDWGVEGEWRKAVHEVEQDILKAKDLPLQLELLQLRRNEKDYLLRGDSKYADAVFAGLKKLSARLATSRDASFVKSAEEDLQSYEQSFKKYLAIEEKVGKTDETGLWGETRRVARTAEPLLDNMLQHAVLESDAARQKLAAAGVIALVSGVALAALFFYFFARSLADPVKRLSNAAVQVGEGDLRTRMDFESQNELGTLARGFNQMLAALSTLVGEVHKSGIQVNTSVSEIAATAKQQQATASEIAATTTEIGATSREISATSKELVKTMGDVAEVADQSATLASSGQAGLVQMEETMRHVMEAAGSINAKLAVLNEKAGNINQVVTTITKVADQTNLLSLNAAIEAEKAGEYGRGFSVVATEIRRLADQTAVATYDIEQMVKEIQSAVAAGVMGMDKFSEEVRRGMQEVQQVGGQLSQIIQQVQALAPRVESVNEGMQAQATGAEQISQALSQLTEAAQQTVESLSQSTLAISELNQVSSRLRDGVSRFQLQS